MISQIINRIREILSLPLVRNTLKLSSSSAILTFLPIIVTPILSRIYSPEDYADWGVFVSVLYIVTALIFLSFENTIVKENNPDNIPSLIGLCLLVSFSIIALTILTFLIGRFAGVEFFRNFPSISLLGILLIITSLHTICNNLANREKSYGVMSIANVLNGLFQSLLRIAFGLVPLVTYGLIVGNVVAQGVCTLFLLYKLLTILKNYNWCCLSFEKIKILAIENRKFPTYDAPARFIEFAISNIPILILSHYWDRDDIGCFSMVVSLILMPISLIGSAMGNVFYKDLAENINSPNDICKASIRAAKISFYIAILPILFLALGGDKLLVFVLGGKWLSAGNIALCLSIYSLPVILTEPLLPLYRALDRQEIRFKLNLINLILTIGSLSLLPLLTDNLYIVLIVYSILYAVVRFVIYSFELQISGITINKISKWFVFVVVGCYSAISLRLLFIF